MHGQHLRDRILRGLVGYMRGTNIRVWTGAPSERRLITNLRTTAELWFIPGFQNAHVLHPRALFSGSRPGPVGLCQTGIVP